MKTWNMFKVNFKVLWTCCLMIVTMSLSAQEICNNGIDDDGDTLIDLNDDECSCAVELPLTTERGNPCGTLVLGFDVPGGVTYQWYKDGVAIDNYTEKEMSVTRWAPTGNGVYTCVVTLADGSCVSSVPYNAIRDEFFTDLGEVFLCEGDTLEVNGYKFFKQGKQQAKNKTSVGCDTIVYFEIKFVDPTTDRIDVTQCTGSTYINGNIIASQPGLYKDTLRSVAGCDSLVLTVDLKFEDLAPIEFDAEICAGDTYVFNGIRETDPGQYTTRLSSNNGCDTIYVVNLSVLEPASETRQEIICQGGLYQFGSISASTAGDYSTTLKSSNNCDSLIVNVELSVAPPEEYVFLESICKGKTFTFRDIIADRTGTYMTTSTAGACDSLIIIELTVDPAEERIVRESICKGKTFDWRGTTYDAAGSYNSVEAIPGECEIKHILELTVDDAIPIPERHEICRGDSFERGDLKEDQSGTYLARVSSPGECDVVYEIELIVKEPSFGTVESVLCKDDTFTLFDLVTDIAGTHEARTTNAVGCDSIITVILTANSLVPTIEEVAVCPGDIVDFHGEQYDTPGSYTAKLTNIHNCDSLVTLVLSHNTALPVNRSERICEGETFTYHNISATTSGEYFTDVITGTGCDSLVTIDLVVMEHSSSDLEENICYGDTLKMDGIVAYESGSYMTVIQNQAGCDSLINLTLNVLTDDATARTEFICEGDVFIDGSIVASEGGRYEDVHMSSFGCDSTVVIDLQVLPLNENTIDMQICPGDVVSFYGDELTEEGTYTTRFSNEDACDSVVTYNIIFDASLGDVVVEESHIINRGAAVDIEPLFVDESFVSYQWLDEDGEIMTLDKELLNYQPQEDTYIYFVATNANGCKIEKRVLVNVRLVINIYVPNVITPDSDNYDSNFNIRSNESVVAMPELYIFDKWGEVVFTDSHIGSLDDYFGWDGVFNNKLVQSGVFTYLAVFEIIDGQIVKKAGDLTVIR